MGGGRSATVVEVGPRDGLQNEKAVISRENKLRLIDLLACSGISRIEATAFVSPRWVPQMADHDVVMRRAKRNPGLRLSVLVPNEKGAVGAIEAGAQELAVFASASETFARKNTNCTIAESMERFKPVLALAREHGLPVRGYVSCAIDCPYEGPIAPAAVRSVSQQLFAMGCYEIAVADTIGHGTPDRVANMLSPLLEVIPADRLACHFHDTSGRALDNVDVGLDLGVRVFDGSAGGLGGCPYAPGATGNLPTRALVCHLEGRGFRTGIDRSALILAEEFAATLRGA